MSQLHSSSCETDIDTALAEAEAVVTARGQKFTPIRRQVMRLLLDSEQPAKAYDLLQRLDGVGAAKPPTVYRALEFLMDMDLAHKIESLNAFVACGHLCHEHATVFLICDTCGAANELHAEGALKTIESDASEVGFAVRRAVIEVRGECANCAEAQA